MAQKRMSFVVDGEAALQDAARGFIALHPALRYDADHRVIYRCSQDNDQRVTLMSGGGSGHEPAHAGYVGQGMLDAAVVGDVFASPNALQVEAGLGLIKSPKGTLIVVKNYTGDKLNFTLAAERFRFASGSRVRLVSVGEDVSIGRTKSARVGRWGLAGTVLVHKIVGAASVAGLDLDEVADVAEFAVANMGTVGVALDACVLPGQRTQSRLQNDEVEIGIGIHNESGSRRIRPQPSLATLVKDMLSAVLDASDSERRYLASTPHQGEHDVVLLMNNLGGVSTLEITAATGEVVSQLRTDYQLTPSRVYAGTFLSALNGPGFSITILSLPKSSPHSSNILQWLDSPTDAMGWTCSIPGTAWADKSTVASSRKVEASTSQQPAASYNVPEIASDPVLFKSIVSSVHKCLVMAEPEITRLDTIMGDGDCGTTLNRGSAAVMEALNAGIINPSSLSRGMMSVADAIARTMGGTSGALYAVFFTGLASALCDGQQAQGLKAAGLGLPEVATALSAAMGKLEEVTAAREGDRTMMDALIPFVKTLSDNRKEAPLDAFTRAAAAAAEGCLKTCHVESKFGRSTYVGADSAVNAHNGLADPGAQGVVTIVSAIRDALEVYNSHITLGYKLPQGVGPKMAAANNVN